MVGVLRVFFRIKSVLKFDEDINNEKDDLVFMGF